MSDLDDKSVPKKFAHYRNSKRDATFHGIFLTGKWVTEFSLHQIPEVFFFFFFSPEVLFG